MNCAGTIECWPTKPKRGKDMESGLAWQEYQPVSTRVIKNKREKGNDIAETTKWPSRIPS